jgi:hypothetical protein
MMAELGPLACKKGKKNIGVELLKKTLDRLSGIEVAMLVPAKEDIIVSILRKEGFRESFKVQRMFFGSPVGNNCLCLAESLERG